MFKRLSEEGCAFEAETRAHIKKYAEASLRTLVVAYRELDEQGYTEWEDDFLRA